MLLRERSLSRVPDWLEEMDRKGNIELQII
jgi:hypothetical protein